MWGAPIRPQSRFGKRFAMQRARIETSTYDRRPAAVGYGLGLRARTVGQFGGTRLGLHSSGGSSPATKVGGDEPEPAPARVVGLRRPEDAAEDDGSAHG